jgi:two-component system, chemotaxis family, protein-glutamate methylesterase/glutaminase
VAGDRIRVLVVDDSPFIRRAVERMLEPAPEIEIVGSAANGREAVEKVLQLRPDVVILDIVMPEVDGIDAIQEIMNAAPTPILVLSTHTMPGANVTLRALELGAVDFVSKSDAGTHMDIYDLAPVLREKVLAIAGSHVPTGFPPPPADRDAAATDEPAVTARPGSYDLLVIGASTGGPRALTELLSRLPRGFPAGILIAQHMPPGFTATLADRLDRRSPLEVREATDGEVIRPGLVLLGVGGHQLRVERQEDRLVARVSADDDGLVHRPSADLLFTSAATAAASRVVGLVLTGMGQDGAAGLAAIRQAGGRTLTEAESSAVIYGMPKVARPWADRVLPLDRLPGELMNLFGVRGS